MGHSFFGLSQQYRKQFWIQIHDLVYHGKGGFTFSEVYHMPIWLRKFNINRINEFLKKQEKENSQQSNIGDDKIHKPGINPSSTYNF